MDILQNYGVIISVFLLLVLAIAVFWIGGTESWSLRGLWPWPRRRALVDPESNPAPTPPPPPAKQQVAEPVHPCAKERARISELEEERDLYKVDRAFTAFTLAHNPAAGEKIGLELAKPRPKIGSVSTELDLFTEFYNQKGSVKDRQEIWVLLQKSRKNLS